MKTYFLVLFASAFFVLAWVGDAHAQGDSETLDQAARITFLQGQEAFEAGDYETALAKFQQAYELSQRPMLLFNIGSTLDRLRRDEEALAAFEQYLAEEPEATDRMEIEARVRQLRTNIAAREQEQREREAEAERVRQLEAESARLEAERAEEERRRLELENATPAVEESGGMHPAIFYSLAGVTVIAGGLSVFTGLRTVSLNDDYVAYAGSMGATLGVAQTMHDDAKKWQNITNALIGVTAAFGISAVVVAIFTDWSGSDEEEPAQDGTISSLVPSVAVADGQLSLSLSGRF